MTNVRKAEIADLPELVKLFESYRKFYKMQPDPVTAEKFLRERLERSDSVIFVVSADNGTLTGFTQLYPYFSSTRMKRLWLLNDLFVAPEYRRKGYSHMLIEKAKQLCLETGAAGLMLQTAKDNVPGNALYPSEGFVPDEEFITYNWEEN